MFGAHNIRVYKVQTIILILLVSLFLCFFLLNKTNHSFFNKDKSDAKLRLAKYFKAVHKQFEQDHDIISDNRRTSEENILDGCYHVYLDVGSNIGVQVRKLYEPEKYPDAAIHPIFDKEYGNIQVRRDFDKQRRICAIGFEPNAHHTNYLKRIEKSYNKCGWRVTFMTETAVSNRRGETVFYTDKDFENLEWGGGILPPSINKISIETPSDKKGEYNVTLIRLSEFMRDVVGKRKLPIEPVEAFPPRVVMKVDIEGSELDVIPDLLFTGGLEYINTMMVEWHGHLEKKDQRNAAHGFLKTSMDAISNYVDIMKNNGGQFDFKIVELDDESFATSMLDLPICK